MSVIPTVGARRSIPALALLFLGLPITALSQTTLHFVGTICGIVLNETGAPAKFVHVYAMPAGGAFSGPLIGLRTDEQGHYCLSGLKQGSYVMRASEPTQGYPEDGSLYYPHPIFTPILVDIEHPSANFDFSIPYKAASLSISLRDAETGAEITPDGVGVTLAARSKPEARWLRTSLLKNQPLLIPPNEDVYLCVSAKGYEAWPDSVSRGEVINYQAGSSYTLVVRLRRVIQAQ